MAVTFAGLLCWVMGHVGAPGRGTDYIIAVRRFAACCGAEKQEKLCGKRR